jgi:hypothetical protein
LTTEEMIEELKKYPGKKVCTVDDLRSALEDDPGVGVAINHPNVYICRQSWHWPESIKTPVDGEEVVVIY